MVEKSPNAFKTIREVSELLDVPQHVLRFWESKFTQIKPMKRGGGRRYYRPNDVDLLKGIKNLLYGQGYTIKGVQKILKENGVVAVVDTSDTDTSALALQDNQNNYPSEEFQQQQNISKEYSSNDNEPVIITEPMSLSDDQYMSNNSGNDDKVTTIEINSSDSNNTANSNILNNEKINISECKALLEVTLKELEQIRSIASNVINEHL